MIYLQPQDIADNYTIAEIDAEIVLIKSAIRNARESMSDKFQDGQADQAVKRQTLENLNSELAIYLKAKSILSGTTSSTAELIGADYNPDFLRV